MMKDFIAWALGWPLREHKEDFARLQEVNMEVEEYSDSLRKSLSEINQSPDPLSVLVTRMKYNRERNYRGDLKRRNQKCKK